MTTTPASTVKWTPGPWRVIHSSQARNAPEITSKYGLLTSAIDGYGAYPDVALANAYLIAAAPEMDDVLDCCERAIESGNIALLEIALQAVRSVRARARGEAS